MERIEIVTLRVGVRAKEREGGGGGGGEKKKILIRGVSHFHSVFGKKTNVGHPPSNWNYDFSIFLKSDYITVTQVLLIQ